MFLELLKKAYKKLKNIFRFQISFSMNKIIFLATRHFTKIDFVRFGVENYLKNEIKVEVWYLNELVQRNYQLKEFKFRKVKIMRIENYFQFERYIQQNISNCLYDLRLTYNYSNKKIFQVLSRNKVSYIIRVGRPNDPVTSNRNLSGYLGLQFKKIIKGKFIHLKNVIFNKIFLLFSADFFKIKKAKYLYLSGRHDYLNRKAHKLIGEKVKLIWGHHRNYDDYLREGKKKSKKKEKIALFIDQGIPFSPDNIEQGIIDVDPKKYYESIRNFLERLNKEFKYEIEISCHPRIRIDKLKKFFPKFKIKIGKTIHQIQDSSLIICHDSTAINFAVLYKKPMIFITSNCLNESTRPIYEEIYYGAAKPFNKECVNIDTTSTTNITSDLIIDKQLYKKYLENFIKFKGPNKFQAEIIIQKLRKDRFWI